MMNPLFANFMSPWQLLIVLGIGVLLFGRRLPEIGRYLGKGIVEFKKGLKGLEDDTADARGTPAPAEGGDHHPEVRGRQPQLTADPAQGLSPRAD
jgi:sec-independent protein translocase protein TatA